MDGKWISAMQPFVKNAADEEQVKRAEQRVKRGRERELDDVCFILNSPQGRRFVWRYLSRCGVFKSSWEPSAKIHFNEGERNIGLIIMADVMEASPDAYIQMMKESKEREKNNE